MLCRTCGHENIAEALACERCGAPRPSNNEVADALIGVVLGGRYRVVSALAEGGMGAVYLGEQAIGSVVRKVAIKVLHAHLCRDPALRERFHRECGAAARLDHPNTVRIYDFGATPEGTPYIVMEFIAGEPLSAILGRERRLAPERVQQILRQLCGALQEAHEAGIVHRDLKPENLIVSGRTDEPDFVKVLDFGIARTDTLNAERAPKLTRRGALLGTPAYMSPQQFTGVELDARSDVYSLGILAYEMLTGRLPFDATSDWQWLTQHTTAAPLPFEVAAPDATVPSVMQRAVLRALAKDPEARPPSAWAFYTEFASSTEVASSTELTDYQELARSSQLAHSSELAHSGEWARSRDVGTSNDVARSSDVAEAGEAATSERAFGIRTSIMDSPPAFSEPRSSGVPDTLPGTSAFPLVRSARPRKRKRRSFDGRLAAFSGLCAVGAVILIGRSFASHGERTSAGAAEQRANGVADRANDARTALRDTALQARPSSSTARALAPGPASSGDSRANTDDSAASTDSATLPGDSASGATDSPTSAGNSETSAADSAPSSSDSARSTAGAGVGSAAAPTRARSAPRPPRTGSSPQNSASPTRPPSNAPVSRAPGSPPANTSTANAPTQRSTTAPTTGPAKIQLFPCDECARRAHQGAIEEAISLSRSCQDVDGRAQCLREIQAHAPEQAHRAAKSANCAEAKRIMASAARAGADSNGLRHSLRGTLCGFLPFL